MTVFLIRKQKTYAKYVKPCSSQLILTAVKELLSVSLDMSMTFNFSDSKNTDRQTNKKITIIMMFREKNTENDDDDDDVILFYMNYEFFSFV